MYGVLLRSQAPMPTDDAALAQAWGGSPRQRLRNLLDHLLVLRGLGRVRVLPPMTPGGQLRWRAVRPPHDAEVARWEVEFPSGPPVVGAGVDETPVTWSSLLSQQTLDEIAMTGRPGFVSAILDLLFQAEPTQPGRSPR